MIINNKKFKKHPKLQHPISQKPQTFSFKSFIGQADKQIIEKTSVANGKLYHKLIETPSVFTQHKQQKLMRQGLMSKNQLSKQKQSVSSKKTDVGFKNRAMSNLNNEDHEKIKILMNRKHQLMQRLRKIDYTLYNPTPTPVTFEIHESRISNGLQPINHNFKSIESKIHTKQDQVYNVSQHQKTIEMLSRLNNQKIRRQEKIVNDMKKKQESELRNLEEVEKNQSQLHLSRQFKNSTPIKSLNQKIITTQYVQSEHNQHSLYPQIQKSDREQNSLPTISIKQKQSIELSQRQQDFGQVKDMFQ